MKVHYRNRALFDLEERFQYVDKRSPSGARNSLTRFTMQSPTLLLSAERKSYSGIHVKVVRQYRYKIFYRVGVDHVEILHVRHGAHRPWSPEK
jgi:plasmid stabilization system protein ParE